MRAWAAVVGATMWVVGTPAAAQDGSVAVEDYLLEESWEEALARSAAPRPVGAAATVLVLRSDGYHRVAEGSNGFTCVVARSWSGAFGVEPYADFFEPALRIPICYNEAAESILREYLFRTRLVLEGKGWAELREAVAHAVASGTLRAPRGPAMAYMLSEGQRLGSEVGAWLPHLMIYMPHAEGEDVGAGPDNPHALVFENAGGPLATLVVPARSWEPAPPPPEG